MNDDQSTRMKRHYWFIGLFGLWCLLSSLWYFLSVKGVNTDPPNFNPHNSLTAIVEILVMLLVACLLGYAIAWWLRNETIEVVEEEIDRLKAEKVFLTESHDDLKHQVENWRGKYALDLESYRIRIAGLALEKEKQQQAIVELETSIVKAKSENKEALHQAGQHDPELNTLRYRIRQLEFQLKEKEETVTRLKNELEVAQARKEKSSVSDHPFVRQLEPEVKDELTKIKGIGPFIEKRLNMIGIYTFQQLADLSPELVDRVGAAIEFFPQRIKRDDWVGQARNRLST